MRVSVATLRVFAAVAESGSIRSAGEKLGRTPSSISEQLKLFENEIGAPLFEGGRKNRLTTVGQFVRSQVRDMLIHYDRTLSAVEAFARNATGRVDIASVPSVATTVLPDVIIEFRNRAPTVEITVRDADSRSVADMVQAGTIELGLGSKPVDRRAIAFEPLFSEPLGIVCRRDDPLFKSARPHGWSSVEDRVLLTNAISDRSAATGQPPTRPSPIIVYNVLSLMALVRANVGVTILPRLAVINAPADIGFVPLNEPDAKRTVGVITRAGESLSPASTSFLDLVRDHLRTSASRFGLDLLGTVASNAASSRRQAAG
jgi:DNA-binding transcriptional LysR family regulator